MELTKLEPDLLQALIGTVKSAASMVPGVAPIIAGVDAYRRSQMERNIFKFINHLKDKVDNLSSLLSNDWLRTSDGEQFFSKVWDAALDSQIVDKQELFASALVQGVSNPNIPNLEKLKFIDMLRHLSLASLMVLAEMHTMFKDQVRGPSRTPDPIDAFPLVDPTTIAEKLSDKYDPYLVVSAVSELESEGLFCKIGEWTRNANGEFKSGGGFATAMCYTDFTARFVEFITVDVGNS